MSRSYRAPFLVRLVSFLVPKPKSAATPRTSSIPEVQAAWDLERVQMAHALKPNPDPLTDTPLTLAMVRASSPELDREVFGKRKPVLSDAKPRLGPLPHYMPGTTRACHSENRAASEGWRMLALRDGDEWAKRCTTFADRNTELSEKLNAETAETLRERERANMLEARADEMRDAIAFCLNLKEITNPGDTIAWLFGWNEGCVVSDEELQNWRKENGARNAEMSGEAVVGRNGLCSVPTSVGHERREPTTVQPDTGNWPENPPTPRTADMASVVEAQGRNLPGPCAYEIKVSGGSVRMCTGLGSFHCVTCPIKAEEREPREMAEGCCSSVSPCSHQQRDPYTLCAICSLP